MANKYPPITIPPRTPKKGSGPPSTNSTLAALAKQYPYYGQWIKSGLIQNAAKEWGVDPAELAATMIFESGKPTTVENPKGAVGLAQIVDRAVRQNLNPTAYKAFVAQYGSEITPQKAADPVFALNYMAWRMAGSRNKYGSLDSWYSSPGYNPGFTGDSRGAGPSAILNAAHVGTYQATIPQTPTQQAGTDVTKQDAKAGIVSPWATITKKGGVAFVLSVEPPANVIKDASGAAYTQDDYQKLAVQLDNLYMPYTGVRATPKQVVSYIKNPVSTYQLQQSLADPTKNPRIFKSPIWQTHASDYVAVYKLIYGNDAVPTRSLILHAITHNLSQAGFQEQLRQMPQYENSEEFKGAVAQFQSGYEQIYGKPDSVGQQKIKEAAKAGWNGDQWLQFLRDQPEYTASGEFQRNVYSLFDKLGLHPQPGTAPTALAGTNFGPMAPTPAPNPNATGSVLTS